MIRSITILSIISLLLAACDSKKQEKQLVKPSIGIDQTISENQAYAKVGKTKLSEYNFFEGPLKDLLPGERVLPYDLNTPLFSDYAKKLRFIYLPEGEKVEYQKDAVLEFPIGTILIKNFFYSVDQTGYEKDKIIETRLLIHQENGWVALPYIWNDEQTEAYLEITGGNLQVNLMGKQVINYSVPDMTQCKGCHDLGGTMSPIGPSVRQLNRDLKYADGISNQLTKLASLDWIELPEDEHPKIAVWDDPQKGTLSERARAYLDINCAHCHNDQGPAKNSGLNLTIFETDMYRLGLNKQPVAAGRGSADLKYGIVAGEPNASILLHRMITNEPGTMMPELGRSIAHKEGIELIRNWILEM